MAWRPQFGWKLNLTNSSKTRIIRVLQLAAVLVLYMCADGHADQWTRRKKYLTEHEEPLYICGILKSRSFRVLRFPPPNIAPTAPHSSSIIIRGWHHRPVVDLFHSTPSANKRNYTLIVIDLMCQHGTFYWVLYPRCAWPYYIWLKSGNGVIRVSCLFKNVASAECVA
jgi:hypothetical protein